MFKFLATRLLALSHNDHIETKKPICFVPTPSRTGGQVLDHAGLLAYWLAKLSGAEFCPALKNLSESAQKTKNRLERRELKISLNSEIQWLKSLTHKVILVDDVITTGATARASYIALEQPAQFEVWTLFVVSSCWRERHLV